MLWYPHLLKNFPQFFVIHTVKGFNVVNEVEVDVFLEFCSFFYDPMDVGNLISGSSAFSKSSWNIWEFLVHIRVKTSLENTGMYILAFKKKNKKLRSTICNMNNKQHVTVKKIVETIN